MTDAELQKVRDLLYKVQDIVRHAEDADGLPYRLAVAIGSADDLQSECFQFIGFVPTVSGEP